MAEEANTQLSEELAAAIAWWRDAGVDCAFHDEPASWLTPPEDAKPPRSREGGTRVLQREPTAAATPPPAPAVDPATLPQDLAAFTTWWLSEPLLDQGRTSGRVPPRGQSGAEIMAIVAEPEREDQEQLLSGPQGRLLEAMLAAMGHTPEQLYLASALPRHTPMADWSAAGASGLGSALAHHVALVAPKRIIAFGSNVLSLLGNDLPNSDQILFPINHGERTVPLLAAADLGILLARPRAKARLWRQWLGWTAAGMGGPEWDGIVVT